MFSAVDHHAWGRLMRWTRRKYEGSRRLGMSEMKRRFCGKGWRFAQGKVVFTGASSVTVTRYRYRGSKIATPWDQPDYEQLSFDLEHLEALIAR